MSIIEYANTVIWEVGLKMKLLDIIKALSHKNRLRIINAVRQKELCVCELQNVLDVNQSNASRHLNKLKKAGIIKSEHKAQWVYYSLNQKLLNEHIFIRELIDKELDNQDLFKEDNQRLNYYQESGLTCQNLRNKEIDLNNYNCK